MFKNINKTHGVAMCVILLPVLRTEIAVYLTRRECVGVRLNRTTTEDELTAQAVRASNVHTQSTESDRLRKVDGNSD